LGGILCISGGKSGQLLLLIKGGWSDLIADVEELSRAVLGSCWEIDVKSSESAGVLEGEERMGETRVT
jgi:hypothetical protein